ncbi:uncharacterized protein PHALS_14460 [Plasmopara halstedii]|uniref:RxLR-like protein n=1 Tax=Plasmopara halstedii TaxID=4781 RepID=A0A0P1AUA4_PLAHL|nr:uncharacterized protein PHALS_14460 [Plasmopara halstedii]CEG44202.1 hypothetical protein PHALS_14460 [Plasmopara halstedii]|eukprot:XP_024580571.1 hypothetical protein PHALS_14460 [Plasmopara halstedii]
MLQAAELLSISTTLLALTSVAVQCLLQDGVIGIAFAQVWRQILEPLPWTTNNKAKAHFVF